MRRLGIFVVIFAVAACQKAADDKNKQQPVKTMEGSGSGGVASRRA
jgi:hypothetical protein